VVGRAVVLGPVVTAAGWAYAPVIPEFVLLIAITEPPKTMSMAFVWQCKMLLVTVPRAVLL
jgi:hypothetical protein